MSAAGARTFHSSPAFLVRSAAMGEADRRLSFFTRDAGVVATVGKSALRSRKRFGGTLQRYVLLDIAWTESPGKLAVLSSASVSESFWTLVEEWDRVRHADYLLEIAAELFPQPGAKPKAFGILLEGLRALSAGESPGQAARRGEAGFLAVGGWGPDLSGCRRCGKADCRRYRFIPSEGGILCDSCPPAGGGILSLGSVKTWRALQAGEGVGRGRLRISESITLELQSVIPRYVEYCLGKAARSLGGEAPHTSESPQFS